MRLSISPIVVAFSIIAILGGVAAASEPDNEIIFDNGVPVPGGGGIASDLGFPNQVAEQFVLFPDQRTITRIQWWGEYHSADTPMLDKFLIRIFLDNGAGSPVAAPFFELDAGHFGRERVGVIGTSGLYRYSLPVDPIHLIGGRTYWLSIVNDLTSDPDDHWYWTRSDVLAGTVAVRMNDSDSWFDLPAGQTAFQLFVPEPSVGLGVAAVAFAMIARHGASRRHGPRAGRAERSSTLRRKPPSPVMPESAASA